MKVCTCLNPLHTSLAIYGCLLGYTLIAEEMKNPLLKKWWRLSATRRDFPWWLIPASSIRSSSLTRW